VSDHHLFFLQSYYISVYSSLGEISSTGLTTGDKRAGLGLASFPCFRESSPDDDPPNGSLAVPMLDPLVDFSLVGTSSSALQPQMWDHQTVSQTLQTYLTSC
jgi:hypothetical protein